MLLVRPALPADVPLLKMLIDEFAEFEHDQASVTEESLLRDGFGSQPKFCALIAEWSGHPAGYALFFDYYLEDLFVRPHFRRKSIGRALLASVAAVARRDSCFGVMFTVMDWNSSAIAFYQELSATFLNDWKVVCLKQDALSAIAREAK